MPEVNICIPEWLPNILHCALAVFDHAGHSSSTSHCVSGKECLHCRCERQVKLFPALVSLSATLWCLLLLWPSTDGEVLRSDRAFQLRLQHVALVHSSQRKNLFKKLSLPLCSHLPYWASCSAVKTMTSWWWGKYFCTRLAAVRLRVQKLSKRCVICRSNESIPIYIDDM